MCLKLLLMAGSPHACEVSRAYFFVHRYFARSIVFLLCCSLRAIVSWGLSPSRNKVAYGLSRPLMAMACFEQKPYGKSGRNRTFRVIFSRPFLLASLSCFLCKWDSPKGEIDEVPFLTIRRLSKTRKALLLCTFFVQQNSEPIRKTLSKNSKVFYG